MKKFLPLLLLIVDGWDLAAQCPPDEVVLTSQAEVDTFVATYPDCTAISGKLWIGKSSLTETDIASLKGLEGLTSVGGDLWIGNNSLTSLAGLEGLTSVGGTLGIGNNPTLTSLTGLSAITSVGGDLWIQGNDALTSLTGSSSLTSVGGYLRIHYNSALTSLTGLSRLTSVGGYLEIWDNKVLTSLKGLEGLTSVNGKLWIGANSALTSLTGLEKIAATGIADLNIQQNAKLSTCAVESICNFVSEKMNKATFLANATGCASRAEVESACQHQAVISADSPRVGLRAPDGRYLSFKTTDAGKGRGAMASLAANGDDSYSPLQFEPLRFEDDNYVAFRVLDWSSDESKDYWLTTYDDHRLGVMGRAKGNNPGARSWFTKGPHQNGGVFLEAMWVNDTKEAAKAGVADPADHWFLDNSSAAPSPVKSADQGDEAKGRSFQTTQWQLVTMPADSPRVGLRTANGRYLSFKTADAGKGRGAMAYLAADGDDSYRPLQFEPMHFEDENYIAFRVLDWSSDESKDYWLTTYDDHRLGVMGRAKGNNPGARSWFTKGPHQNGGVFLEVMWVNDTKEAAKAGVADPADHWFLDNSSAAPSPVKSTDQGDDAKGRSLQTTEWLLEAMGGS